MIDGDPWFVAGDVGLAMGWSRRAVTQQVQRNLNDDERCAQVVPTSGGPQRLTVVSESGLYKLILRAQRACPAARDFQDWVTRVVLPAIRKDGGYVTGEENAYAIPQQSP